MEEKEILLKRRAIIEMAGGRKIISYGGSIALTLPRIWATLYGTKIDGVYWAKMELIDDKIIISQLDEKALRVELENNNVNY